ncbi:MAG TPA: polysaccharide biosynthesis/export family protein [Thermoanaerobaculia bacterium]|jgi:polysaccharide export outer membrane protein|nr:polysaccharide biosynthesis/export family protein [Thermoanaerobaculia bacterium]
MKRVLLAAAAIGMLTIPAFSQRPPTPQPQIPAGSLLAEPPASASDAPIGPRDQIEVKVYQDPNLYTRATVSDDGRITMPLIGKVDVSGLTPTEVEQRIKALLEAKYINKADVTVTVTEAGSKPISVIGAVMRPGRIGITGNITLIQAITQAGGLGTGYGRTLYVLRTASNGLTEQIAVDIDDLMVNGNPDLNLPLRANDVINVPIDSSISIYVLGEVMHPGPAQFRRSQTPTLLQVLASAGGPTDRASKRVVLKRMVGGTEKTFHYDFRKIIDGRQNDIVLMDGDRLIFQESFF